MGMSQSFVLLDVATHQEYCVRPEFTRIGRLPENSIVLDAKNVSRHHATLWVRGQQLYIRDEQSTNGTQVNGVTISAPTALSVGDHVQMGQASFQVAVRVGTSHLADPVDDATHATMAFPWSALGVICAFIVLLLLTGVALARRQGSEVMPVLMLTPTAEQMDSPEVSASSSPSPWVYALQPDVTATLPPFTEPRLEPVPTGTQAPVYAAPQLLGPPHGSVHHTPRGQPGPWLSWHPVGVLESDEVYRIIVDYPHEGHIWREIGWSDVSTWQTPYYLLGLLSHPYECAWFVQVVRVIDRDAQGNPGVVEPVSPVSETWMFTWTGSGDAP